MSATTLSRRTVMKTAALATTAVAAPFVHGAFAAGKLSCGFWDHWVPTATAPLEQLCREWAAKEQQVFIAVRSNEIDRDVDLFRGRRGASQIRPRCVAVH